MTFLAPWALALGIAAALGALLLHLVAQHRPAAYVLPTARFIPERDTLVSRAASRPSDLLLLAIRMLLLVAAGAAFARPVIRTTRAPRARIVLLDRSSAEGREAEAMQRAREASSPGGSTLLITFDSAASAPRSAAVLDSLGPASHAAGSISAALVAARRAAPALARVADSVELVLVSPVVAGELDAATDSIRASWPGTIRVERVGASSPPAPSALERTLPLEDPLGPSVAPMRVRNEANAVRVVRRGFNGADSSFARAGGVVVRWDSVSAIPLHAEGLAVGDDVIVAPLGRRAISLEGAVRARWADGAPAAREFALGTGCLRDVGVALPAAGDVALRPGFQRIARGLLGPCGESSLATSLDEAAIARLAGNGRMAAAEAFDTRDGASPITPWLLGLALLCAIGELVVRATTRRPAGVRE